MSSDIIVAPYNGLEVATGTYAAIHQFEYQRWTGASQSRLKLMRDKSPAHVRYELDHPRTPTEALIVGTAIHTCVLEPDLFPLQYGTAGQCEANTRAGARCKKGGVVRRDGAWFCETPTHDPNPEQAPDAIIGLTPDQLAMCLGIRDRIAAHPQTRHLLKGDVELSALWRDPEVDVLCRGRFDVVAHGVGCVTDIKSTRDAHPLRFAKTIYELGYHIQGAHYLRGARELGIFADTFCIIAAEKEPPYEVAVYELERSAIMDGERELIPLLERWAECEATGVWPGYSGGIVKIDLPTWAPDQITKRLESAA